MRAIHIVKPRQVAFLDAPKPEPLPGEVIVQCQYVALCGSNMGQYTGEGVWGDIHFPNPAGWAGHENIGTVVESRCDGWKPGTLVLAQPEGYYGFAEFIRAKPPGIAALPADAPDVASLIVAQPVSTVLRALSQTDNVVNQRCAVIGQGPMGLIWTHLLGRMGARQVIAIDKLGWRLKWARRFGASETIDASKENVVERVKELTGGAKVDFCADVAGKVDSMATAVHLVRRAGRVFVFGMPDYNDQKFPWYDAFRAEATILTSVGPECSAFFQTAVDMVVDGRVDLGAMVTPRMPWEKAPEAFEMYATCAEGSLKLTLVL